MHLVSAFASELGVVLGQIKTAEKSNEISAIPALLELLDLNKAVVTIDAMGCQSKIIEKMISKGANYLIGLKGDQGQLNEDVRLFFEEKSSNRIFYTETEYDKEHGRLETRRCRVTEDINWLKERYPQWKQLTSVVEIESCREIKKVKSTEKRYYISSLTAEPKKIAHAVRQHWGAENQLHWVLDMSFNDDQSRIRKETHRETLPLLKKPY